MDSAGFLDWIDSYERAWRTAGTDGLAQLFHPDAVYLTTPYAEPITGLPAIAEMWEAEREGPDEAFAMSREVVAVSGAIGVGRVEVSYGDPVRQRYRDLWVVHFGPDGRAVRFEEWPFWPSHGATPVRPEASVVEASDVSARPWQEIVRSGSLSAGVYALEAGAADSQQPHTEDEVYVVVSGAGVLEVEGRRSPVGPGSIAYVPANAEHRFVDITSDLRTAVVFAPPET